MSIYLHPNRKKKMKHPEQVVQIGMMSHLLPRQELEDCRRFMVYAVPNGGLRSKVEAGIMKAMGSMAGVLDLTLLMRGGRCVFVEIKLKTVRLSKKGKTRGQLVATVTPTSDDQKKFMRRARALGFDCHTLEATDINNALNQFFYIMGLYGLQL